MLEGNYWSDYPGVDDGSGVGKHAILGDGIGDTLIPWPGPEFDYYPLMNPWTPVPPVVTATVDIDPDTLNLKSKGKWITCYIGLPAGFNVEDIDVESILLNDAVSAERFDIQDGVLMVKFPRSDVVAMLSLGDAVVLTVTGELTDGTHFEGTDMIRVISKGK